MIDETVLGEIMALRIIAKINSRLKFLYRKNRFLDVSFHRIPCNALIQPHLDYAFTVWYLNLTKKLKDKLQVTQNKCIRFCLKLQCREDVSNEHIQKLKWQPINHRFKQCIASTVFKFVQNKCPAYMNEVFRLVENIRINTRNSYLKLSHPFQKKNSTGQNDFLYINGPAIWNWISEILEKTKNLNSFKRKMKHYYLNDISNSNLWNIGGFFYVLAIIRNVFRFIGQIYLHLQTDWRSTMKISPFTYFVLSLSDYFSSH